MGIPARSERDEGCLRRHQPPRRFVEEPRARSKANPRRTRQTHGAFRCPVEAPPLIRAHAENYRVCDFSTRRQEEITRISWIDLDTEGSRVLVRDMKNPGEKIGNDTWCDLPQEALQIILSMPRTSDEIFPYSTDAIGAAFTRAGQFLEIDDLHFHDLRHDGVSRLFEIGLNIPRVASVSGHRSWTSLKRYTHLRQTGDKYAGWKWLPIVTLPKHLSPVEQRKVVTRSPARIATTEASPGELGALKSRRQGTTILSK